MNEVNSNKEAWSTLSKDHYNTFKKAFENNTHKLNCYIEKELGNISGKELIHLQCNTGADTILRGYVLIFLMSIQSFSLMLEI